MRDWWSDGLTDRIDRALDRKVQRYGAYDFKRIFNAWENMPHIRSALSRSEHVTHANVDAAILLGYVNSRSNARALDIALSRNVPLILCENGFISAAGNLSDPKRLTASQRLERSVMLDKRGLFFDATRETDLEHMLNHAEVSIAQIGEARRLIDEIVDNKVTRFNYHPIFNIPRGKKRVLVVDQTYKDFSVTRGIADDMTFRRMLEAACDENPDADVLVKTHPFVMAGRQGYYSGLLDQGRIKKVSFSINPYSLLECCDKVYVCTSNLGFEALLAGKEVHTFGMPYYAGWGLTKDELKCDRRKRKLTVEELFYIFAVEYTRWVDTENGCATSLDSVIDKMVTMRKEMGVEGA